MNIFISLGGRTQIIRHTTQQTLHSEKMFNKIFNKENKSQKLELFVLFVTFQASFVHQHAMLQTETKQIPTAPKYFKSLNVLLNIPVLGT